MATTEIAVLGGGCFWCLEAVYLRVRGVVAVTSGYAGDTAERANYREVCSGTTKHVEVVKVEFDPAVIPFTSLLEVFFGIHDPTTRDRQGADAGPQYRSVVFCQSDAQMAEAHAVIAAITELKAFARPIVTDVIGPPSPTFYPAEDYHQNYFDSNPSQPYCRAVVLPKVLKLERHFTSLLRVEPGRS